MSDINPHHSDLFEPWLKPGEPLVWTEAPDPEALDYSSVIGIVMGVVCALFWGAILWFAVLPQAANGLGLLAYVVILALVVTPPLMIWFSIRELRSPRFLIYAITSRHLMVHDTRNPRHVKTARLSRVRGVKTRRETSCTVRFKGLDDGEHGPGFNRFVGLSDPTRVEALVLDLISKKESP